LRPSFLSNDRYPTKKRAPIGEPVFHVILFDAD
jgi:hypothetical protein